MDNDTLTDKPDAPTSSASPAPVPAAHKRRRSEYIAEGFEAKTKGEKQFNFMTYTGVGYFGVTIVSVLLTWLLNDGPLAKSFGGLVNHLTKDVTKKSTREVIGSAVEIVTLFIGGSLVSILPIKMLEDNKSKIVKKFDEKNYSKEQIENDPMIINAHKELDAMPKQTWMSVFNSRLVAFVATLGVFLVAGSNKSPLANLTGESIQKRSTIIGRATDRAGSKLFKNTERVKTIDAAFAANAADPIFDGIRGGGAKVLRDGPKDTNTTRLLSYSTADALYTLVTANALFLFTRVFGALMGKESAPAPATDHVAANAIKPVATPTPANDHGPRAANDDDKPRTRVAQGTHLARVAAARGQEVTA